MDIEKKIADLELKSAKLTAQTYILKLAIVDLMDCDIMSADVALCLAGHDIDGAKKAMGEMQEKRREIYKRLEESNGWI